MTPDSQTRCSRACSGHRLRFVPLIVAVFFVALSGAQTDKQKDEAQPPPGPTEPNKTQTPGDQNALKPGDQKPPTPKDQKPESKQKSSLAQMAAAATSESSELQGDYIPCKFTLTHLRSLITPEVSPTLTAADEETLKARIISEALSKASDQSTSGSKKDDQSTPDSTTGNKSKEIDPTDFIDRLTGESLAGLTPSQALNTIIRDLSAIQLKPVQEPDILSYKNSIVETARQSIALLERPPDVGCAMSILTYGETNQAFGHLIANTYIAVQVVVRNLNREQAFVLHDVELQVNADPAGRIGRFYSGRDKVIVRALSSTQSSFDPRAIVVHSAQGIGAILSAVVPIFSNIPLTDATARLQRRSCARARQILEGPVL